MQLISLALIDDHPIIIEGLTHVLGLQNDFKIVATGRTYREALAIVEKHRPELIILDTSLPGSGPSTIAAIKAKHPNVRVLVFTAEPSVEHAVSALEAGAQGYVSKSCALDELLHAARSVFSGEIYVSRNFGSVVITALRNASLRKIAMEALKLSAREDQIVRLLLDGKTNREIATGLGITERTVKHYMTVLMQKLNARNRVEVVIAAQNLNRYPVGSPSSKGSGFSSDQLYMTGGRPYHS
ncbi:response regulator transcription factor [Microvirga sp. VF16]|uniref:response regulator n=1 Tax=Microvirga sp. VF16 TaxID=2807101 RepID=UPI00193DC3FF|nr:response regulator transcription factor [Microvirga sp. VF16]QRM30320.1 response regulator transcription factor [Microvirga sp. VF16]